MPSAGPETIELANGTISSGQLIGLREGSISWRAGGGEQKLAATSLARLARVPFRPTARLIDGVALTNGDLLEGQATEMSGGKLKFQSTRFGTLSIDSKLIRALFFDRPLDSLAAVLAAPAANAAKSKSEVLLTSGSRTSAELRWLDSQKVGLSTPIGSVEVNRPDVAWILLNHAPVASPAGATRLRLSSGECLTGLIDEVANGQAALKVSSFNTTPQTLKVSWDLVCSMESPGEHLAFLSAMTPTTQSSDGATSPARLPRPDACAAGGPLRLGDKEFEASRGIGMRGPSKAAWSLDGTWQRFRSRIGLDQRAMGVSRGVVFRVVGDGRTLFEKELLPGQEGIEVDLAIGGVKNLALILDRPAARGGLELGDYGDWIEARLLR